MVISELRYGGSEAVVDGGDAYLVGEEIEVW